MASSVYMLERYLKLLVVLEQIADRLRSPVHNWYASVLHV